MVNYKLAVAIYFMVVNEQWRSVTLLSFNQLGTAKQRTTAQGIARVKRSGGNMYFNDIMENLFAEMHDMNSRLQSLKDEIHIKLVEGLGNSNRKYDLLHQEIEQISNILVPKVNASISTIGCKGITKSVPKVSGVYSTRTNKSDANFIKAYCDMVEDGGGWTVIQRRGVRDIPKEQRENFYRNWTEYVNGFGSPKDDHWIGLKAMHSLTTGCENELRVTLTAWNGTQFYAKYSNFQISTEENDYTLTIGDFTEGTLNKVNHMSYNNKRTFSTFDKGSSNACALNKKGAWWFGSCSHVHLNGEYADDLSNGKINGSETGIFWYPAYGYGYKKSEMKIRSKC